MRATDGLQTTINLGPVHRDDQAFSLQRAQDALCALSECDYPVK